MEFYLPIEDTLNNANLVPNSTFAMLLYQNDGTFYTEDQKKSALDSEISMDAFKRWTQFYTNYKFPLKADFPNRFRTGEMPIGIADYTTYNMLTVMARKSAISGTLRLFRVHSFPMGPYGMKWPALRAR